MNARGFGSYSLSQVAMGRVILEGTAELCMDFMQLHEDAREDPGHLTFTQLIGRTA